MIKSGNNWCDYYRLLPVDLIRPDPTPACCVPSISCYQKHHSILLRYYISASTPTWDIQIVNSQFRTDVCNVSPKLTELSFMSFHVISHHVQPCSFPLYDCRIRPSLSGSQPWILPRILHNGGAHHANPLPDWRLSRIISLSRGLKSHPHVNGAARHGTAAHD